MISIRCAAVLSVVLAVAMVGAGCVYPTVPGGTAKACDLRFQPSKPIVTGPSVLGQLAVVCDVAPERHELTMWLEHRARTPGASWQARNELTSNDIPGTTKTIHQLLAACLPGAWRVRAHVVGTLGGTAFEFTDKSTNRLVGENECT